MAELRAPTMASVATPDHDFGSNWAPVPDWASVHLDAPGVSTSIVRLEQVCVVNGDLQAALQAAAVESVPVGWPDLASGDSYAVRLARDRALIVGGAALTPGWHGQGFAVSRSDDAAVVFTLAGPGIEELLSLGAAIFLDRSSASAVRLFAGLPVILYRHGHAHAVRMHVARPRAAAMLEWLRISLKPARDTAPSS